MADNVAEFIIAASDRAGATITGLKDQLLDVGTTVRNVVTPAFTAFSAAALGAIGGVKNSVVQLLELIERTDSLLQRFAGTTLKEVINNSVNSLVEEMSNAANSSFTEVASTVAKFGKLSLGFDTGKLIPVDEIDLQLLSLQTGVEQFTRTAGIEFDLLALKIEGSMVSSADEIVNEFERIKGNVVAIAQEFGADAGAEIDLLALKIETLAGTQGIDISLDPAIQSVQRAQSELEAIANEARTYVQETLGRVPSVVEASIAQSLGSIVNTLDRGFLALQEKYNRFSQVIAGAGDAIAGAAFNLSGADEAINLFSTLQNAIAPALGGLAQVGFQISQIGGLLGTLQPIVASGPYQLLIQQNITLREQLLATQSTLAGTNKVLQAGVVIDDPFQAITSLQGPVEEAIAYIREQSVELAGVTSSQLVDAFRIVAGQAGNIGIGLQEAADLTLDFAAGLGTLGIPLFQAQQEISSILTGQIDVNSVLGKALNLNNAMVQGWQQQGTLVTKLRERLEAFREGNKLAAASFAGITSNIQEVIENVGLAAGEALLDPVLEQLQKVYEFLLQNRDAITAFVTEISGNLLGAIVNVTEGFGSIFSASQETLVNAVRVLFQALTGAVNALGNALKTAATVFEPFFNILGELSGFANLLGPLFQVSVTVKALTATFSGLTQVFERFAVGIPVIGEFLFIMEQRSSGLIGLLTGLGNAAGTGAAGFLTLGKNLENIPFLQDAIASRIPVFGNQIAALIPTLSGFGIAAIAIFDKFPQFGQVLDVVRGKLPEVKDGLLQIIETNPLLKPFASDFEQIANKVVGFSQATDLGAVANEKFAQTMKFVREQVIATAIRMAVITGAIFLAAQAFDKFVLQNEELLEFVGQVGEGLASFANDIKNFVISPFGLATVAIVGTTTALIFFGNTLKTQIIASALPALVSGLGKAITLLQTMTVVAKALGATQFATFFAQSAASVAALSASAAAGTVTVGGLATAFGGLAASVALALAPIAALIAGIALIGITRYTKDLADSTEATQEFAKQNEVVSRNAIRFAERFKAARDRQAEATEQGIELTEEEKQQNEILQAQAELQLQGLDERIALLKQAQGETVGDENKRALDAEIVSLTAVRNAIAGYSNDIELAGDAVFVLQNRVKTLTEELKRQQGQIDATTKEGIAQYTEALRDGLVSQRELEDQRVALTREGLEKQLSETEKGLQELLDRYNKLTPEEKERAKEIQDGITQLRAESADLRIQIAESEIEEERRLLDRFTQDAQNKIQEAETDRNNEIQRLVNAGQITREEAAQEQLTTTRDRIRNELKLEEERLQKLSENEAANQDEIIKARQRIRELTGQLLQNESQLYDAHIALIKSKLEEQAQAYANQIEAQNQKLRGQLSLYEALGRALEFQRSLAEAQQGLTTATSDFLNSTLGIISNLERSDFRRRQLAQVTAAINLQSLQQRQELESRIFEIQQQQNRLALERQRIENQIAIAQQQAEIARGQAQVEVGRQELAAGRITQAEFDARVLTQSANVQGLEALLQQRGLIQQQIDIQPQLEAAQRQQFRLQQQGAQNQALGQFADALPPGALRNQVRRELRDQLSQQLNFEDYRDLRSNVGNVREIANNIIEGRSPGTNLFDQATPNLQRISNELDSAGSRIRPVSAQVEFPPDLQQTLSSMNDTIRQLGTIEEQRQTLSQQTPQQMTMPSQQQAPRRLTPEQIQALDDAIWNQRSGFAGPGRRIEEERRQQQNAQQPTQGRQVEVNAPINVTVNATGEGRSGQEIANQVNTQLENVVRRASQLATTSR